MARGVEFEEYDVSRDSAALEELVEVLRSRMTPTTVIGERVVIGFDPDQLDELLAGPA